MATKTIATSAGPQEVTHRSGFVWSQPFVYLVALIFVVMSLAPVMFVVLGGFRDNVQLTLDPAGMPDPWVLGNYSEILFGARAPLFWGQVLASSVVALTTTAMVVMLGVSVSFVIARFEDFRGRGVLYAVFAAGLMFPATIAILPLAVMMQWFGLFGSWWGVILPQVAFALPTTVIILTPFLKAIPQELEEAAAIDGTTRTGFFFRILLPLSRPGMVTVGVLAFIGSWNAYMLPLFVLGVGGASPDRHTLPLGVQMFSTQYSANTAGVMAFTTLAVIPALLFFLAMEKQIVNGLSGAVKG